MEESDLEARGEGETAVPLCRHAGAPRASRLLAIGTASGGMVVDRMAGRGNGTHQVLAIHSSGQSRADGSRAFGQTSLDHRTGLSGIEAGTRVGPLRRTRLARLSSPYPSRCIAAYGFLVAERSRFSPSAQVGHLGLPTPEPPPHFRPRGSPRSSRAA